MWDNRFDEILEMLRSRRPSEEEEQRELLEINKNIAELLSELHNLHANEKCKDEFRETIEKREGVIL